jgi:hypothetical protein
MKPRTNLAASVAARLLNRAHATGDDYQTLLTSYCFERLLYRLGESAVRDRFVLKGAMLLRRGDGSPEAIRADLQSVVTAPVEPDAVVFDSAGIRFEAIRAEDEYAGTRATLPARCGTARLALQIDMGFGDSVWPAPRLCVCPPLLDLPAPEVLAYPREAVVAEKLEALVVLGDRNSRIKDFFDLHHLASRFEFDRATVAEAVRRTFARRRTPIPVDEPIGLTLAFWENPSRPAQVRAFARRAGLALAEPFADEFVRVLGTFLSPIFSDLRVGTTRNATWVPGGPWR